eukprot:TRINITY_DN16488_c0_g1_i1.p1 TRINITY_DN16488_c0_g1~~TRINITY_DN16488_c0_g1_i1.p1  ORF type:complete len:156 (+),score=22.45 TRINITY_DN16488_c0_g1_i1:188-655(+)
MLACRRLALFGGLRASARPSAAPALLLQRPQSPNLARVLSTFTDPQDFHRLADKIIDDLQETLEDSLEEEIDDLDVNAADGVLNVSLGDHGTYVINKQGPNQQIWLSSPVSGPWRYDYDAQAGAWVSTRDGHALIQLLTDEIKGLTGIQMETTQY